MAQAEGQPKLRQSRSRESLVAALRQPGHWNSDIGDLAPHLLARLFDWQLGSHPQPGGASLLRFTDAEGTVRLRLWLQSQHYSVACGMHWHNPSGDGDCLFRAVLHGLGYAESPGNIARLREDAARLLQNDWQDYAPYIPDLERSPSPVPDSAETPPHAESPRTESPRTGTPQP